VQILAHNPEIQSYSNEDGHFITGFLIGTKPNEARWQISKRTGHELVQKFVGKDFAIIPELINKPLSEGGGGHYFGQDTKEDLLKGYAENSHGKYTRVKGPYSYNDGSDDYYYNFDIKLRDSKAASALLEHGSKTWVPYSHSPHIWPLAGPDDDIYDWEPIGGALVIKGAYGPQAVISKLCKGTASACEKSLGASSMTMKEAEERHYDHIDKVLEGVSFEKMCGQKDGELAQIITSLVSKTASSQISMPENKDSVTNTPQITTLTAEVAKPNATVNAQEAITTAKITNIVTPEQYAESEKSRLELEKRVTELVNKDKLNTLNNLFAKVKDEKAKEELIKKYSKLDNVDQIKEIINELYPILRASEEEEKKEEEKPVEEEKTAKKGRSGSLPKEPELPKEETESKAASVPVNKIRVMYDFLNTGGRT
jgi:hypothetical protein